jgi:hypothetical protein
MGVQVSGRNCSQAEITVELTTTRTKDPSALADEEVM